MLDQIFLERYGRLLESVRPFANWPGGLCGSAALKGKYWSGDVVFYGRALNGWVNTTKFGTEEVASCDARLRKARQIWEAGRATPICELDRHLLIGCGGCDDPQMHWVHHKRNRDYYSKNTVASSRFWSVIGSIICAHEAAGQNWSSWVAWSNLYKVAPFCGGNPTQRLMRAQFTVCKELLEAELDFFRPRVAIFLTETAKRSGIFTDLDENGWLAPFLNGHNLRPVDALQNGGKAMVLAGSGKIGGHRMRLVAAVRPETLKTAELSDQILAAIRASALA